MSKTVVVCQSRVVVDLEAWERNYGDAEGIEEIHAAVRDTADEVVQDHFRRVGVLVPGGES